MDKILLYLAAGCIVTFLLELFTCVLNVNKEKDGPFWKVFTGVYFLLIVWGIGLVFPALSMLCHFLMHKRLLKKHDSDMALASLKFISKCDGCQSATNRIALPFGYDHDKMVWTDRSIPRPPKTEEGGNHV